METLDIVILGAGPAGLQAAIHAARRGVRTLLLGRQSRSALVRGHIENYAFVEGPVPGESLLRVGKAQAERFGARFLEEDAVELTMQGKDFLVRTESGTELTARAVIIATGSARKKLGVPGEKELEGRGVSYCADCDAGFFKKKRVVVVGEGSAAASGALHLSRYASEVTLACGELDVTPALAREVEGGKVRVLRGVKLKEILGRDAVEGVRLSDGTQLQVEGVFIEIGAKGVLELASAFGLALDDEGNLKVDRRQATSYPGLFAAGDVTGPPWQLAKAVGEGCIAGIKAAEHVQGGGKG